VIAQVGLNSTPPSPKPLGVAPGSSASTSTDKIPTDKNTTNTGNGDKTAPSPHEEWRNPTGTGAGLLPVLPEAIPKLPKIEKNYPHTSDSGPEAAVQSKAKAGTGRGGSKCETPGAAAMRIASSSTTSIVAQDKAQDGAVIDLSRCKFTRILSMC